MALGLPLKPPARKAREAPGAGRGHAAQDTRQTGSEQVPDEYLLDTEDAGNWFGHDQPF
jgi:hypothetical protein